ncbi:MAG: hypothetical protein AAFU49_16160 [Pseudomonadota bacterium]
MQCNLLSGSDGRASDRRVRRRRSRQRNTDVEKAVLKAGRVPEAWAAQPAKLRQKDRDGRWTLKRGRKKKRPDGGQFMQIAVPVYGDKSHIGADRRHRTG